MILVIIRMKVLAEKRKELSQTIASLIGSLSPSSHKFGDEFIASGLSAVRQAHRPEHVEGLREQLPASSLKIRHRICESKH
jgi:hypothetical protein